MWLLQTMYEDPIDWSSPEGEVFFWPEFFLPLANEQGHWLTWFNEGTYEQYCDRDLASGHHDE